MLRVGVKIMGRSGYLNHIFFLALLIIHNCQSIHRKKERKQFQDPRLSNFFMLNSNEHGNYSAH